MKGRDGRLTTRTVLTKNRKKHVTEGEEIPPGTTVVAEALSNVGYTVGYTKGLPNYSSVRVEVSCHLPCKRGTEIRTFKQARLFALKRLRHEVKETMESLAQELDT